ncbi:hypothetical protein Gpo141_00006993 [Globisporangium polare]
MDHDEKQALENQVSGRVRALREMFNKGGNAADATPPERKAAQKIIFNKRVIADEKQTKDSNAQFTGSSDTIENNVLRKLRERREAEKKAEKEAMEAHTNVKSTKTLVDKAADGQKLRKAEDRRIALESRELYSKTSSYDLNRDPVYQHSQKQKEEERNAEKEAKESLLNFTRNGDHDHLYTHAVKQKEDEVKAEREAKESMRKYSGGKSYVEEKMEEKKRKDEAERQKVQETISGFARNNFSSPEFDPAYVRAKELEQIEREAEEKAKASLLQFSQHDVSHEMMMRNGFMVRKTSVDSDTSSTSSASPATSYPFTDKSRKKAPSPAAVKAVARFQQQLAESRAKEEARAERKASIDSARKMSIESARKMSIDEPQRPDPDLEQIKASVDESRLSVKSAAQKFKEMERKAAAERVKTSSPQPGRKFGGATGGSSQDDTAGLSLFELHARNMRQRAQKTKAMGKRTTF